MEDFADVVIVGGGIGGTALAKALADAAMSVTVLERQVVYRDRIRGEYLHPWGATEARALGVEDVLVAAGGTWITSVIPYDELVDAAAAEASPLSIPSFCPESLGGLDVGHPEACRALADEAGCAGARLVRGVGDIEVRAGQSPSVRYELDDELYEVRTRLVVGADGRSSSMRRQLGIELHSTDPWTMCTGLLVNDLSSWPSDAAALGTEGDVHFYVFPRQNGTARLYQIYSTDQKTRFTGPDRQHAFLESFRLNCLPLGDEVASATAAGPVGTYPMNDSWVTKPCVPGAVLIGDAAGWSDPVIGEGLSIALRDARSVAQALTSSDTWAPGIFEEYVVERAERMRRFRICARLHNEMSCVFTPEGRRHRAAVHEATPSDPDLAAPTFLTLFAGPDAAPAAAFDPENIDRILAIR